MVFQFIFIILFFSTSFSKIFNFNKHINFVESYKIPTKISSRLIVITLLVIELLIPIGFLFNYNYYLTVLVSLTLLALYSLVAIYHLKTSKETISCGCGGMLNTEDLSTDTVIRNLILIALLVLMIFFPSPLENLTNALPYLMIGLLISIIFYLFTEYRIRFKEINLLQKDTSVALI